MSSRFEPVVLLVEDNPGDARLFELACEEADVPGTVHVATDAAEARGVLRGQPRGDGSPPVDLVVLDLDLPDARGTDLLAEIRTDPALASVPVVVLSSAAPTTDAGGTVAPCADGYLQKGWDFEETLSNVETLCRRWLETADGPVAPGSGE
jgi:CheY-like chemotaxis protein